MNVRRVALLAVLGVFVAAGVAASLPRVRAGAWSAVMRLRGRRSVQDVLERCGAAARARLGPIESGAPITLAVFKRERRLDVMTKDRSGVLRVVRSYPVLAASGGPGPKTCEGDNQVPEGFYRVESLNPNSAFHLALRLNYPSRDDLVVAAVEGRGASTLGGDIMIHGGSASVGCVAVGDAAIEELFVLAADAGPAGVEVMILPHDPRSAILDDPRGWVRERYDAMSAVLRRK